ncbi:hypothetical protein GCM10020331_005020 [Ectobacillus funiculus]
MWNLLFITGNKDLLHQVWTNLITNSIKFTEFGGTISIHIDTSYHSYICIMIEDTGIGISEEDIKRIFLSRTIRATNRGIENVAVVDWAWPLRRRLLPCMEEQLM